MGVMMGFFSLIGVLLFCKNVILQNRYPTKLPYDKFWKII